MLLIEVIFFYFNTFATIFWYEKNNAIFADNSIEVLVSE